MISEYAFYDSHSKSKYNRISIDGTVVGCSRCVGYCKYDMHPGFLTEKMRKVHHCIEKGCNYYLEKDKYEKKDRKVGNDYLLQIEKSAKEHTSELEGMASCEWSKTTMHISVCITLQLQTSIFLMSVQSCCQDCTVVLSDLKD